ncbi:MAG TPA: hypothetical protein DCS07_15335 [Bdellovibrionales bacterium]|nr:MAG: hypothetical protein A2Z97_03245 [Bdellovibrionales bacterium GWB1_52_6]OFZ02888.1 MAG: hypothetical protein A2X97_04770 [Bdellovibrionales bacterium GWA1_52_35]OFZ44017.1 MAG: hypothetical protein A2070_06435 [Bdellovibrionales bacterium GWC1_52_8]HAR43983.1 hypothetical protein [Bdellovibrionales bacterium]HCM38471.1 hypothetical protein [Bdellovibrionales bacterium]
MQSDSGSSFIGLGKTLFNSSVARIVAPETDALNREPEIDLILTERLNRKKASGAWPEQALLRLLGNAPEGALDIAENRDVLHPAEWERFLNQQFPFAEYLKKRGLELFSSSTNPSVAFVPHHLCHASAAQLFSPFDRSIILVMDGAGTRAADFPSGHPEIREFGPPGGAESLAHEEYSVYLHDLKSLRCVYKSWQFFKPSRRHPSHHFSEGLGTLYEKSAEYIFKDKRASGKVMGLASFGISTPIHNRQEFLDVLDWKRAFQGGGKERWENSGEFSHYADLAASIQNHYEESLQQIASQLRDRYPEYRQLIFTGGSALNCTNNMKMLEAGYFDEIYTPPFPGDECIGLGAAAHRYFKSSATGWHAMGHNQQRSSFGSPASVPTEKEILTTFADFQLERPSNLADQCAEMLANGKILAWCQGRSECGPRALGHRSILARPDRPGIKDYLNRSIKFREAFRPYGGSCLHEKAPEYFKVPNGFNNPFMSFAPETRPEYRKALAEITHQDLRSRVQTVRRPANPLFYDLIDSFGQKTGLFCLLNTSLNVMGEPIVETAQDALRLLTSTPVDGLIIGNFLVHNNG